MCHYISAVLYNGFGQIKTRPGANRWTQKKKRTILWHQAGWRNQSMTPAREEILTTVKKQPFFSFFPSPFLAPAIPPPLSIFSPSAASGKATSCSIERKSPTQNMYLNLWLIVWYLQRRLRNCSTPAILPGTPPKLVVSLIILKPIKNILGQFPSIFS